MRILAISAVLLLAFLTAARCADPAEKVDLQKLYDHIHKTYSTPSSAKLLISGLKPSPIKGMLSGTFELGEGEQRQVMPILVSMDGRSYILSDVFETTQSSVPALRIPISVGKDQPAAPPILVSDDGRYVVYGPAQDASVDPEREALSKMNLKDTPSSGPADAPVLLVEYSDLECPFCEKAHSLVSGDVMPAYGKKVRWVFKHYPLRNIHPWAYDAAIAAACAGRIKPEAYMGFIAAMFRQANSISPQNLREKALGVAKESGVDGTRFAACFDKKESQSLVDAEIREADSLGVTGTPTFFVNGRRLRSYQPAEVRRIIDEKLAGK